MKAFPIWSPRVSRETCVFCVSFYCFRGFVALFFSLSKTYVSGHTFTFIYYLIHEPKTKNHSLSDIRHKCKFKKQNSRACRNQSWFNGKKNSLYCSVEELSRNTISSNKRTLIKQIVLSLPCGSYLLFFLLPLSLSLRSSITVVVVRSSMYLSSSKVGGQHPMCHVDTKSGQREEDDGESSNRP